MTIERTSNPKSSLLFIDPEVTDRATLANAATDATEVHFLQSSTDAIDQITQILLGRSGIETIGIVSHGTSGQLKLGNSHLNTHNLNHYAAQLRSWSNALTEQADILLYGCNLGATAIGTAFIDRLAQITGADVAGSSDLTGNIEFGGNWELEVATGQIEALSPLTLEKRADFRGTLNWQQLGQDINGEGPSDRFGDAVALSNDGRTVAIGAPSSGNYGKLRVYRFDNDAWTQLGNDINGESLYDFFSRATSISADGNTVAIGGYGNDGNGNNSGHVRIYRFNGIDWEQLGVDIEGEAADDRAAAAGSVSLSADGNTVAIGGYGNDDRGIDSGHIRIFRLNGTAWRQIGSDIDGIAPGDNAGTVSISADGNIIAIGAANNDNNGTNSGHVRIYRLTKNDWEQVGNEIAGVAAGDRAGYALSLSGNGQTIAIGANNTRIYRFTNNSWIQASEIISEYPPTSISISDDGNTVAISTAKSGAKGNDHGQVMVYRFTGNSWAQVSSHVNGTPVESFSGQSIALSEDGNRIAIGVPADRDTSDSRGYVRVYRFDSTGIPVVNSRLNSEVIARDKVTGEITIAYTNSTTQESSQRALTYDANIGAAAGQIATVGLDWTVADTADFNRDGIADILLHNQMGDEAAIWLVGKNGRIIQAASLYQNGAILRTRNTRWRVVGFADLDRDNILDLIWHNQENDAVGIWFMNSDGMNVREYDFLRQTNGQILKTNNPLWQVKGLGDFDGDGDTDLLYRLPELNATAIVQLDGILALSSQFITSSVEANLVVDQIIDSDNNGTADIYWRNPATSQIILQPIKSANYAWQATQFKPINRVSSAFQSIMNAQGQTISLDLDRWELLQIDDFGRLI